jgi:hypothetical protein
MSGADGRTGVIKANASAVEAGIMPSMVGNSQTDA